MISVNDAGRSAAFGELSEFREEFYRSLCRRADALFELSDAVLCTDGPVLSLVGLSLAAQHRRGHGALYDAVNNGVVEVDRLRRAVIGLPLPRDRDGRIVLTVDVSAWLRPDAATAADRSFCHVYGRGKNAAQIIPGWAYSFVAALETGRSSWTAVLDVVRIGPLADATTVTAGQVREVIDRLREHGRWCDGDPRVLIVFDAGYDVTRLAWLLRDLPVDLVGRLRSDRVLYLAAEAPCRGGSDVRSGTAGSSTSTHRQGIRTPLSPRSVRPAATVRRSPTRGTGHIRGWPGAAGGRSTPGRCPSSRAPSSGYASTGCPVTGIRNRCGCGCPRPG